MGELGHADTIVLQPDFQAIQKAKNDLGFGPTLRILQQNIQKPLSQTKFPDLYTKTMQANLTPLGEVTSAALTGAPVSPETDDLLESGIMAGGAGELTMKVLDRKLPDEALLRACSVELYYDKNQADTYLKLMGDLLLIDTYREPDVLLDSTEFLANPIPADKHAVTAATIRIALLQTTIQTYFPGLFAADLMNGLEIPLEQVSTPSGVQAAQLPGYTDINNLTQQILRSKEPKDEFASVIQKIKESTRIAPEVK